MGIFKKRGKLYDTTQLANVGVELPPRELRTLNNRSTTNPVGFTNIERSKYELLWRDYDIQQICARYVWEGLPNGEESWNVERMLYFRGGLCGFETVGKIYILPYVIQGSLNLRGMPNGIRPVSFNGEVPEKDGNSAFAEEFKLHINEDGNQIDDYDAVLLWDRIPVIQSNSPLSRWSLNRILIHDISETLARVAISVIVSTRKMYFVIKDANQRDIVQKEIEQALGSDSPYEIITSMLEVQELKGGGDLVTDALFNTIANYDAMRTRFNGVSGKHFGSDKKERLVAGELMGDETQVKLIQDVGLEQRQLFCKKMNKRFGTKITVRLRESDYAVETNGSDITDREEMEKHGMGTTN